MLRKTGYEGCSQISMVSLNLTRSVACSSRGRKSVFSPIALRRMQVTRRQLFAKRFKNKKERSLSIAMGSVCRHKELWANKRPFYM